MIASTVGTALGLNSTVTAVFSLFLVLLSEEFGVPRAEVSVVLLIVALTNAVMYPLVGRLADRIGSRLIILSGIYSSLSGNGMCSSRRILITEGFYVVAQLSQCSCR